MNADRDVGALLAEASWLSTLARRLVHDVHLAEDLVQDTWLSALERRPDDGRPLRGWLATALGRRRIDVGRAEASRRAREERASRPERSPASAEVVERAEIHRDLVQAVLALAEPSRTTLLLRFYDGLPVREIARREGVGAAAVHSRIARGLAELRASLDGRHGRRSWLLALTPLVRDSGPIAPLAAGALAVNTAVKIVLVAVPIVLAAVWWSASRESAAEPPLASERAAAAQLAPPTSELVPGGIEEPAASAERTAAQLPVERSPERTSEPLAPARMLQGRVIGVAGQGIGGVTLTLRPPSSAGDVQSGADGTFAVELSAPARSIEAADRRWATVLAGHAEVNPESRAIVVVAPRLELAGVIVDEDGAPLEAAALSVHVPAQLGADFGFALDHSLARTWRAASDARGAFAFPELPAVEGASLRIELGGYETRVEPLPAFSDAALAYTLARPRSAEGTVSGVVVDPAGAFVAGARVSAGGEVAQTDAQGRFALDVREVRADARIHAVARGYAPAVFEPEPSAAPVAPAAPGLRWPRWPRWIVLQLGPRTETIAGRVVDERGNGVAAARVWVGNATLFGELDGDVVCVESLTACDGHPFWCWVASDAEGRFRLEGLLPQSYRVRAIDPRTLVAGEARAAAGSEVEIRLETGDVHGRLRGRVLTSDDSPVAGATVKVQRMALEVAVAGGTRDEFFDGEPVRTAADGSFELRDVPRSDVELFAWGDDILFTGLVLQRGMDVSDLVIRVSRRMHLQVELTDPMSADSLRVLDAEGRALPLRVMRGDMSFTNTRSPIEEGRSQVLSVADTARTWVLERSGREIARGALALEPGELNVLRY